jgi:hypothetical protein
MRSVPGLTTQWGQAGATLQTVDIEDRLFLAIIYLFLDGFSKFKVPHIALNPYYMPIERNY